MQNIWSLISSGCASPLIIHAFSNGPRIPAVFSYPPHLFQNSTLLSVPSVHDFTSQAASSFACFDITAHAGQKHQHTCWLTIRQAKQINYSQHSFFSSIRPTRTCLSSPTLSNLIKEVQQVDRWSEKNQPAVRLL